MNDERLNEAWDAYRVKLTAFHAKVSNDGVTLADALDVERAHKHFRAVFEASLDEGARPCS